MKRKKEDREHGSSTFIRANEFGGARTGYVYRKGDLGLGYYLDGIESTKSEIAQDKKAKKVSFSDTRQQTVDARETLGRLSRLIGSPNVKKAEKALAMLGTLLRTSKDCLSSQEDCALIIAALRDLESRNALKHPGLVATVVASLAANMSMVAAIEQADVATWFLSVCCPAKLRTDDTYVFVKAMNRVREAIEALQKTHSLAATKRRDAILHCIAVAWPIYLSKPFAKAPVESCCLAAANKRSHFSAAQRHRLDYYTTAVRDRQRLASSSALSNASLPNRTVRIANSIAHPFRDIRSKNEVFR